MWFRRVPLARTVSFVDNYATLVWPSGSSPRGSGLAGGSVPFPVARHMSSQESADNRDLGRDIVIQSLEGRENRFAGNDRLS